MLGRDPKQTDVQSRVEESLDANQSKFLQWMNKKPPEDPQDIARKSKPHIASIEFKITVHQMDTKGQISAKPVPKADVVQFFRAANMTDAGEIFITGSDLCDTITKVDKVLRLIHEQNKRK